MVREVNHNRKAFLKNLQFTNAFLSIFDSILRLNGIVFGVTRVASLARPFASSAQV